MYRKVINKLNTSICEYKDYRTQCQIVVFESDDWGSIRMTNRKDWESLRKRGYAVHRRPYERYDTLESASDLALLFDILCRHKGADGNHPIITANMLMANPDFERIQDSGYQEYYYEPIATTYERYFGNKKILDLMRQGYGCGVFMPQSHGREHFNVIRWIKGLQSGNEDYLTAFSYRMCGIAPKDTPEQGNVLMKALYAESEKEQLFVDEIVNDGLRLFEEMWHFKSKSFVAPCYCWSRSTEKILASKGVELIQTSRASKESFNTPSRFFYTGKMSDYKQVYSVRNCSFEPATKNADNSVEAILKQVDSVFQRNNIAIISSHRINYVSGIDEKNRSKTLDLLDNFLSKLIKKYPNVVFMSSDKLLKIFQ